MDTTSTFVISITPFTSEGELDEDGLRGHLGRMAAAGIGVYVGGSGSGEGYTLSPAETRRVLEIAGEELVGAVPVRAMGREPRTAAEMIAFADLVADVGLPAMQVYSLDAGHGVAPHPAEMRRYYSDVLDACRVPVVLSSHQSVGYWLPVDLLDELLARYDVAGLNITSPDMVYLRDCVEVARGRAEVHVGGPMHAMTCLAYGGTGYLSSEANLAPHLAAAIVDRHNAGDVAGRDEAFTTFMGLFGALIRLGGIRATKAALGLLGLPGGWPRLPRLPLGDDDVERVRREVVEAFDVVRWA